MIFSVVMHYGRDASVIEWVAPPLWILYARSPSTLGLRGVRSVWINECSGSVFITHDCVPYFSLSIAVDVKRHLCWTVALAVAKKLATYHYLAGQSEYISVSGRLKRTNIQKHYSYMNVMSRISKQPYL